MKKKKAIVPMLTVMCMSLTACVKSPQEDIVQNKDFDVMIEEAENTEEDAIYYDDVVEEVNENAQIYQTELTDATLGVEVYVDAEVIIPEVDKLSVYRVSQKDISQEFIDKVRETISPGVSYYDGSIMSITTKDVIAMDIQFNKELIEECNDESLIEEYQRNIEELEQQYEVAPERIEILDYPSDNLIHSVEEKYNSNPNDAYYSWQHSLTPSAKVFYGMSDGADGHCRTLYAQNNCDYGNCLRYESTRNGYAFTSVVVVEDGITDELKGDNELPVLQDWLVADCTTASLYDNEPLSISESDARGVADKLMTDLGLSEYEYYDGGLYFEHPDMRFKDGETFYFDGTLRYREIYEFVYMRNMDGVLVDNTAGAKLTDGWAEDTYVKKLWSGEAVVVCVNDDGIVGFKYLSPISIDETIVEKASIKSFDEVKEIFEQMVVIENVPEDGGVSIEVDSVELVYARISEKDSFDTGILVPVWNFKGTSTSEYGMVTERTVLSINAIDGSVIDWELGY